MSKYNYILGKEEKYCDSFLLMMNKIGRLIQMESLEDDLSESTSSPASLKVFRDYYSSSFRVLAERIRECKAGIKNSYSSLVYWSRENGYEIPDERESEILNSLRDGDRRKFYRNKIRAELEKYGAWDQEGTFLSIEKLEELYQDLLKKRATRKKK